MLKLSLFNLISSNYSFFNRFCDINALMITAGFGKLALFKNEQEQLIIDYFNVNAISVLRLVKRFYTKL